MGVKVYTIAVGVRGEAPIPVTDAFGNKRLVMARVGLVVGAFLAYLVTLGGPYLWEIVLPGSIVGVIVGYATMKYQRPKPAGARG